MTTDTSASSSRAFFESLKDRAAARALVETYQRECEIMRSFHSEAFSLTARRAFHSCAKRIGIPVRKVDGQPTVLFGSENEVSLLNIFCLMLDDQSGIVPRKKFVRAHAGDSRPDVAVAVAQFDGYRYSWFRTLETVPGTGFLCEDLIAGGEVVVADIQFSLTATPGIVMMGGVLPVVGAAGPCQMTDGAWLPVGHLSPVEIEHLLKATLECAHIRKTPPCTLKESEVASLAATSIRMALACGCDERVIFHGGDEEDDDA